MKNLNIKLITIIFFAGILFSCSDDEKPTDPGDGINYDIPSTYDFENVSYTGQITRQQMLNEMKSYIEGQIKSGSDIDSDRLLNMYRNNGNKFDNEDLNASDKDLSSKTAPTAIEYFEDLLNDISNASTTATAESGSHGIVVSGDESRTILVDANGMEYTQILEKGLMGACFFYQAANVYLTEDKIGDDVDNETLEDGKGTPMQHHWDEAFGYFGANNDFPENTDELKYHAKYCNSLEAHLGLNSKIMEEGFSKGRAAINNDDHDTKWKAADKVREHWELVLAATGVHYLNSAKSNYNDDANRLHALSEAYAFIWSIQFNPERKSEAYKDALEALGSNLWEINEDKINNAKQILIDEYDLGEVADVL